MGDRGAGDPRDRRLGVDVEAHGVASVREEARSLRRTLSAVDDESQRDEMNAAIRAQRERGAVPRSMLPPEDELPEPPPARRGAAAEAWAASRRLARALTRNRSRSAPFTRASQWEMATRRTGRAEAGAADRRRVRRRAHRRLCGRLRGRRAVLLVLVQPRRPRGARRGSASILVSSDGTRLGLLGASGVRQPVALRRISPVMRKAIIDTEDRRFYRTTASTTSGSCGR